MKSTTIIGWLDGPIPAHAAAAYVDVDNAVEVDVRAVLVGLARRRADRAARAPGLGDAGDVAASALAHQALPVRARASERHAQHPAKLVCAAHGR